MVKNNKIIFFQIFFLIMIILLSSKTAFARWSGPSEVVSGTWGSENGQFGFVPGDPTDGFPRAFIVDTNGNILIADLYNKKVNVYKDSSLITVFTYKNLKPGYEIIYWPSNKIANYDSIFIDAGFIPYQFYDYQGNLIREITIPDAVFKQINFDGKFIVMNYKTNVYYQYSPTGELLQTYTEKPLELGRIEEKKIGPDKYRVTVKFRDKQWVIEGDNAWSKYTRDASGYLYGYDEESIARYMDDGTVAATMEIPDDITQETPIEEEIPHPTGYFLNVIEEYGIPVLSPNGDVYTWKRTQDKYYILKWTWQN